ncbi:MAG: hypothetical protein AAF196_17950 [Planctomycetota bacterium]
MRSIVFALALSATAFAQPAPQQLSIGFGGNFSSGSPGTTCYFDLTVNNPNGLTLFRLDHNLNLPIGATTTAEIRFVSGPAATFILNETNAAFWPVEPTRVSTITSAGPGGQSSGDIPGGLFLVQGRHAIAITYADGAPIYDAALGATFQNADLQFLGGSVSPTFLGPPIAGTGARVWNGELDYFVGDVAIAVAESFGFECPAFNDATTILESFSPPQGTNADLQGSEVVFTPNGLGGYVVTSTTTGSGLVPPGAGAATFTSLPTGLTGPIALGVPVTGPDGTSTNTIEVSRTGRVTFGTSATPPSPLGGLQLDDILSGAPSVVLGADYDLSTIGSGPLTVEEFPVAGEVHITWTSVQEFGQNNSLTTQIVLSTQGILRLRFESFSPIANSIVGISQGGPTAAMAMPLQFVDLSSAASTSIDSGQLTVGPILRALNRPVQGGVLTVQLERIRPSSIGQFLSIGFSNPTLIFLTPPTGPCVLWSSGESTLNINGALPVSTNLPPNPAFAGLELFLQGFSLDPTATNPFFVEFSNGVRAAIEQI